MSKAKKATKTTKATKATKAARAVNFIGSLGYISVVIQWVVSISLLLPFILTLDFLNTPDKPAAPAPVPLPDAQSTANEPSLITFIGIAALVAIIIGLTIYIMAKMPVVLAKTSKKAAHSSSDVLTKAVLRISNQKDTKKIRERLAPRILLWVKLAAIILPVGLALLSLIQDNPIASGHVAVYTAALLADISLFFFVAQYGLAKAWKVSEKEIW